MAVTLAIVGTTDGFYPRCSFSSGSDRAAWDMVEESSSDSSDGTDSDLDTDDDFHRMSALALALNVAKSLVGEGILSLPAGFAAGTGLIPGLLIMAAFGLVMMYSFWSIGRCCEAVSARSHGDVGQAVGGYNFAFIMEVSNLVKAGFACVAYSLVIGKNASDVLGAFGLQGWFVTAQGSFLTLLVVVLLPLCLLRDLSKLAFSSLFGLLCEIGVVIFMIQRLVSGDYRVGGQFHDSQLPGTQVAWGTAGGPEMWAMNLSVFVLIGNMSTAFLAHYNAPKFYDQLRTRTPRTFLQATSAAFLAALLLYATGSVAGYLTFGQNCYGNILHNYSPKDPWALVSRLAMLLATICGFPFCFMGFRTATLGLLRCEHRHGMWLPVTLALLLVIGILGSTVTDLGLVNSLQGIVLGSLIQLVFPGFMILWTYQASQGKPTRVNMFGAFEGVVAKMLIGLGLVLLIFGTSMVLCIKVFHRKIS